MEKHWCILEPDLQIVKKLTQDLACTPAFAKILVNRKIESAEQAVTFLHPSLKDLRPPFALKDMDAAVHRIGQAIAGGEKILIFGDYDVDGVTSAIVILEFLNHTGTNPSLYIPHRLTEGYGLQIQHVIDYAIPKKIELIITTDCGSSSHEAVQAARSAGIDVIVTDHHRVSNRRPAPDAIAMVNPKRPDCEVGFEHLSGVGVAFMLTVSLRKHLREIDFWHARSEPNL
ncbi:MAG: DHH family phosphoesterase, partial [Desulfobacterales bacterium]